MKKKDISYYIMLMVALMFVFASFSKLFDIPAFEQAMKRQMVPQWSKGILVWSVPAVEIVTVALLFVRKTRRIGFLVSSILMFAFTMYISLGLLKVFAKIPPCSCGGIIRNLSWTQHLIFNIFFLVASLLGYFLSKHSNGQSDKVKVVHRHAYN